MKQVQDAYIVAATRSPIGRSHKGSLRHTRPDELLAHVIRAALAQAPGLTRPSSRTWSAAAPSPKARRA